MSDANTPHPPSGAMRASSSDANPYRELPSVSSLLESSRIRAICQQYGRSAVVDGLRVCLLEARRAIGQGAAAPAVEAIADQIEARLDAQGRSHLRATLNATGILIHTNLGRAPLAPSVIEAISSIAKGGCNVELDLETGQRGGRASGVTRLLTELTGAEAAHVVNNAAGATLLTLRSLAAGREVVVSRGQLVEIGGSYRLPEVFEASGARLVEVGTTNKTRLDDYRHAIGPETAALLRVHTSNYRIVGFTESVAIGPLAQLAHEHDLLAIDDIGSGVLRRDLPPGLDDEPNATSSLDDGADLVIFSGDKLLGGPQSGLILGRAEAVATIRRDPLARALRVDKLTLAALEATLRLMRDPENARTQIPLWRMLSATIEDLERRADRIAQALRSIGISAETIASTAYLGGGSLPDQALPSLAVRLDPPYPTNPPDSESRFAEALRQATTPIITRISQGRILLDLRSLPEHSDEELVASMMSVIT